jgi:hypothetical protein
LEEDINLLVVSHCHTKELENLGGLLAFIEFTYNSSVHSTINFSQFEIVYDFYPFVNLFFFFKTRSKTKKGKRLATFV